MDALIYSPILSHPANAGNRQAVYHIGKYMQSMGYVVHFVYYTLEGLTKETYDHMRREWDYFDVIVKSPSQPGPRTLGDVYARDDWYQEDVGDFLLWKANEFDIRLILFHYIFQCKALELLPRHIRKILHTHDRMSNRHRLFDLHGMDREFFYTTPEEEGAALRRADEIIAVQAGEADFFHSISGKPVHVLRQYFPPRLDGAATTLNLRRIGYLGSNNIINIQSIRSLATLFRNYRMTRNSLTLVIAGGVSDQVRDLAGDGVEIMGRVENVEKFYKSVDLVVNPMMFGTGLKIKTVEALSFGAPIVSTRSGMSGIETTHPYHACDSVEDVVQAIDLLVRQPTGLEELRRASVKLFADYYADTTAQLQKIFPDVRTSGAVEEFLRDGLTVQAFEFGHTGWYSVEEEGGGSTFRWLGPDPVGQILVKIPRLYPVQCDLTVIGSIRPDIFRSLAIDVDGMPVELELELTSESGGTAHFLIPPSRQDPNRKTKVAVKVRETLTPKLLNPENLDTRQLGVAVRSLTLKKL